MTNEELFKLNFKRGKQYGATHCVRELCELAVNNWKDHELCFEIKERVNDIIYTLCLELNKLENCECEDFEELIQECLRP